MIKQREEQEQFRHDIVVKYARLRQNGEPMFCIPSIEELEHPERRKEHKHTDGKVIFNTREQAVACARELYFTGDSLQQYPYPCGRASKEHYHLARDMKFIKQMEALRQARREQLSKLKQFKKGKRRNKR